ncbi:MAG: thiamine-phosphate kinase [Phycisphaerae bacterium]|jgi:thiamine-monophosphate kinase
MSGVPVNKSETELIRRLRARLDRPAVPPGLPQDLVDDMALLAPGETPLLWTVDMLMDGVDFESARHSWHDIGRKAMGVNLSDCAAMAAQPVAALCAVSLNDTLSLDDALALHDGARDLGLRYGCPIVGGDTNSWAAPTVISITVAARPEPGRRPVCRDGARLGDRIYVTGPLGGSLLGRHMRFEPRIETALAINRTLRPGAMIDVSDGLAIDLWRVLEASGCGATVDAASLDAATHADAHTLASQDGRSAREHALYDGEDFELIVVLPSAVPERDAAALGLLPLGRIDRSEGLVLLERGNEHPIERRGWEHFR